MAKGIHEGKTLSRDNQRSGDWREILQSTYREEKSSGRIIFLGFGRCKIHGNGAAKEQEQQTFHFRKLPMAAKAKAAPASPHSQIPRFLINSNCGGSNP